jgi:voltage-gated potassium channel
VIERSERIARAFEVPMLVAAVLVIPLLIIEESSLGQPWVTIGTVLNWTTWLAFLSELVVMLAVVPDRRRWLREHPVEVVSVVLTPPFLPSSLAAARVLRLLRLVRLLRLAVVVRRLFTIEGVRYVALLAFVTVLAGGTAFASVEDQPKAWDGIWWAATTMTTVGYGDITPTTDTGRVIALFVMVVGIGFGSILIGAVAERFVQRDVRHEAAAVERQLSATDDELLSALRDLSARLAHIEAAVQRDRGPAVGKA